MGLVPCPNNGACGSRSHNQKSARYRECLASARFSGRGTSVSGMIVPRGVGPISKPVQLSGEYKVYIPDEERASEGWISGIRDETPHKLGEIFEQMGNSNTDRPKIKKYKYA